MKNKQGSRKPSQKGGKQAPDPPLSPTVISASPDVKDKPKSKRGVKTASDDLKRLIEMANLAGNAPGLARDMRFPAGPRLVDVVMQLPDPVRTHLLELMNRPEQWNYPSSKALEEVRGDPETVRQDCQAIAIVDRYHLIFSAKETLESIVRGDKLLRITGLFERRVDAKGKYKAMFVEAAWPRDAISQPLLGVDLEDIRRCPVCDKFFYARRATSVVCDPDSKCADTYAKRQERKNAGERKRLAEIAEKNAKKKRAKTAPKR